MNLSWFKGAHALRFGLRLLRTSSSTTSSRRAARSRPRAARSSSTATRRGCRTRPAPADTRFNSWADFLLGLPSGAGKVEQLRNPNSVHMQAYAAYAQDQWQVTRDLTLNYGLRWEFYPWPTRGGDVGVSRFDPDDGNVYTGGLAACRSTPASSSGPGSSCRAWARPTASARRRCCAPATGTAPIRSRTSTSATRFRSTSRGRIPQSRSTASTNAFIPVTTLRLGLERGGVRAASRSQPGRQRAAARRRHDDVPEDGRAQRTSTPGTSRCSASCPSGVTGAGRLRRHAREGTAGLRQHQRRLPGTGNAGRPLSRFGILSDINMIQPVRRHDVPRAADRVAGRSTHALLRRRVHAVARRRTTRTTTATRASRSSSSRS